MKYLPNPVAYEPGKPRAFLAFEDRRRDLSDLLNFGTVIQIFPSETQWQLSTGTAPMFREALERFFQAHDFTDQDFVVALGDPIVIHLLIATAAQTNGGRVKVLKWDRVPCPECNRWKCEHPPRGRYFPVALRGPVAK
jgi:hypothetical protein